MYPNTYLRSFLSALMLFTFSLAFTSCNKGGDSNPVAINPPLVKAVNRETYLSGKQFCETYKSITSAEYGRFVKVPANYSKPNESQLNIYVYSLKPFDPAKPTYIYVDGGPGQNTHGLMPDYFEGRFNELRFDQRGLGCSAPENYDIYKDSSLYSSLNNIRDMEEIRKAYGIQKWSVYGVSYGTVPSTMYGSKYPDATTSVVLEGVFGRPDQVHLMTYKAEKMNLALAGLNTFQRQGFSNLIDTNNDDAGFVLTLFFDKFYSDTGMRKMQNFLKKLIAEDGTVQQLVLEKVKEAYKARDNQFSNPQQPGAVDENILHIIYCKNLDYRNKQAQSLQYSNDRGFYAIPKFTQSFGQTCDDVQVSKNDEQPYKLEDYPVTTPIYYFQGSHDGATMAIGALNHWKTVAKGLSYFLLAQKGGHNPNITRLEGQQFAVATEEKKLLEKGMLGAEIQPVDLDVINGLLTEQKWLLFRDPTKSESTEILTELQGIKLQENDRDDLLLLK